MNNLYTDRLLAELAYMAELDPFDVELLSDKDIDILARINSKIKDDYLKNLALLSDMRNDDNCEELIFECNPAPPKIELYNGNSS